MTVILTNYENTGIQQVKEVTMANFKSSAMVVVMSLIVSGSLLTGCGTALHHGLYVASQAAGWALPAAGAAASVANGISSEDDKDAPTATFAPEIDTEQTVRGVLDKGGESKSVMVLSDNVPVSKILFYKRGDLMHPILFTYNDQKGAFVYQELWTWERKEFDKKKDTPEYRKACEEWYSTALARRGNQYEKKGKIDVQYEYIRRIESVSPIGAGAYNAMAWFYSTCPNPDYRDAEKAVAFAEKSVSMTKNWHNVDTLAAAYAEAGDFDKAIELEEEAIRMCTDKDKKTDLTECWHAYRSRKTYGQWKHGR